LVFGRVPLSTPTSPTFLHLDLDQFFVSAERLDDPSLRGVPVCVGSADPTARGAVACASYEARSCGVYAGQALRRAKVLCPDAVFVDGRPERYLELSRAVQSLLVAGTPRTLPRSVDEFCCDLTGCERLLGDPLGVARRLQAAVLEELGLPCSIGVAGTPLVAKVAASEGKPRGLLRVLWGQERDFLAPLAIRKLPGVGPVTEARLRELSVLSIGDLAGLEEGVVARALGGRGRELWERAHGGRPRLERASTGFATPWGQVPFRDLAAGKVGEPGDEGQEGGDEEGPHLPRSVSRQRTFGEDQDDRKVIDRALVRLVESAQAALRVRRLGARSVALHVRYTDMQEVSRRAAIPRGAQEEDVLARVRALVGRLLTRRVRIRRVGVSFHGLTLCYPQLELFEGPDARSRRALGEAMDTLRVRFGWDTVRLASGVERDDAYDAHDPSR
jgi:DNA polymerase IV